MNQKIFNPAIVKCMEKNPSIANPRYNEHIFPVPCTSLDRRSTVAGMTDKWGFKRSRILKDGYSPRGGYSLIWPIRGCAAGQGMDFGLSVLNRVCDFVRVRPKQGI